MPQITEVIRAIKQTEKGARLAGHQQFVLEVAKGANKPQIKAAVEAMFKVDVLKVNTQALRGKWRRLTGRQGKTPDSKKAVVTLAPDQKIELK